MKTYHITPAGEVTIVPKPTTLKEMQNLVHGNIEIVNARMPKSSALLKDSEDLQEMVCDEEFHYHEDKEGKENKIARQLVAEGLGLPLDNIQKFYGCVFVTDGWRID